MLSGGIKSIVIVPVLLIGILKFKGLKLICNFWYLHSSVAVCLCLCCSTCMVGKGGGCGFLYRARAVEIYSAGNSTSMSPKILFSKLLAHGMPKATEYSKMA